MYGEITTPEVREPVLRNVWGADEEGLCVRGAEVRMKDSSRKFINNMHRAVENPASYPGPVMAKGSL